MKIPVGKGRYVKIGKTKLLDRKINVIKWNGKEKEIEYWECNKCVSEK